MHPWVISSFWERPSVRLHKPGWHGLLLAEAVWDEHQPLLLGYKPVGHVAVHTECYGRL